MTTPVSGSNSASIIGVLVLAGDLANPAAGAVADDQDLELGGVPRRVDGDGQPRAGVGRDARAQRAAQRATSRARWAGERIVAQRLSDRPAVGT